MNQGSDLTAYCDGLIDTGISRVPPSDSIPHVPPYHGTVQAHPSLLEFGRTVIKKMSEDPPIQAGATPTLLHPDLHKRNLFISDDDPAVITGIIDWQSCSIEPAFWHADETPDFARPIAHPSLEDQLEPSSELCAKTLDLCTRFLTPKLAGPRAMDEALFRPFRYCYRTWKDGAVAFREELIETSRCWGDVGLAGECPFIMPTPEELVMHKKEYKMFEAAQQLRSELPGLLNCATDGWVPNED